MNIKTMNDNVLARRWNERYESFSQDIKDRIDLLDNTNPKSYVIKKGKRNNCYPNVGTLFEIETYQNVTLLGIVVKNHLSCSLGNDLITVLIFRSGFKPNDLDEIKGCFKQLLLPPQIVTVDLWKKGYFMNSREYDGNVDIDYCFFDIITGCFFDENGKVIKEEKSFTGTYGITTIYGLSNLIQRELIISGIKTSLRE